MTALYIALGILLLLAGLLLVKISFRISWCNDLLIAIKIGFYKKEYLLFSKKEETEEAEEIKEVKYIKKEEEAEKVKIKEIIPVIKETVSELYSKTKKHIRLDRYIVKITVATEDPAVTGVLYGAVAGSAASLLRFVEGIKNKTKKQGELYTEVKPDFISEKPDIFIDIVLSTRVWRGLSMAYSLSKGYNKYKQLKTKGA